MEMPDGRAVLLPQMIDARLRDIISGLSLPIGTGVKGPNVRRIPRDGDETNWDCSCEFIPDPEGNFSREFDRAKNALRTVFKLPEPP